MLLDANGGGAVLPGCCFCGQVRYEARSAPFHETLCHCADCRRVAGAPAVAWFTVRRAALRFTAGAPKLFRSSPRAVRRFCADCGTQLTFEADATPAEVDITTASLDDPEAAPPRDHSHAESRLSWDRIADDLPVRPEGPVSPGAKSATRAFAALTAPSLRGESA